jgi:hypothetical protein
MSAERGVHERMLAILSELPAIGKNQKNVQQGFMFRGHDDILNALNPLLASHGVIVVPDVLERETAQRTTAKGGVMYEVNLHVRYRFYGPSGDYIEASTWGEGTDSGDKATNKAMTMAFKNVLNQAFAISSEEFKDADAETPEVTTGRQNGPAKADEQPAQADEPAPENRPTNAQHRKLAAVLKELETTRPSNPDVPRSGWEYVARDWIENQFQKKSRTQLTKGEMALLIDAMEKRLEEEKAFPHA